MKKNHDTNFNIGGKLTLVEKLTSVEKLNDMKKPRENKPEIKN
jgi:hypothetical protein